MKIVNIIWDTDNEEIKSLPTEVDLNNVNDPDDIADILSDMYGFCVYGFCIDNE